MNCPEAQQLLLEFVEGTLEEGVADEVRQHIEACAECMKRLEEQSSRTRRLVALGRIPAPDQLDEITSAIERVEHPKLFGVIPLRALLIALAVITFLGPGVVNTMIAIGIGAIPGYARLIRGDVLSFLARDHVLAARSLGAGDVRRMVKHLLGNHNIVRVIGGQCKHSHARFRKRCKQTAENSRHFQV